jgi:leader peptidase (prepilin peptidase)/N-methyltransferase
MLWLYLLLGVAAAWGASGWLRQRSYRRADDTLQRQLSPWWVPVVTALAVASAGPFFAGRSPAVVLTYLLALVWAVVLAFIDLEVCRLPDALVLPAYGVAAALLALCSAVTQDGSSLLRAAACSGVATAVFFAAAWFSPRGDGLGLGDVKLAGVLGALLGWFSWTNALMGLLTGFVLGGVGALVLLLARRAGRRSDMPFGPAMVLGAYLWCLLVPA